MTDEKSSDPQSMTQEVSCSSSESKIKILFWNVSGICNKNDEFWKFVKEFDIVILIETWLTEKKDRIEKVTSKYLTKEYDWIIQFASETGGRQSGGIILGIKENKTGNLDEIWNEEYGILGIKVVFDKCEWIIFGVYNNDGSKEFLNELENKIPKDYSEKRSYLLIGGDFNAKTKGSGRLTFDEGSNYTSVKSECEQQDTKGSNLVEIIKKNSWTILNASTKDESGGIFTYKYKDKSKKKNSLIKGSVIDYVITNSKSWEMITSFKVSKNTSDYYKSEKKSRKKNLILKLMKKQVTKKIT